MISTRPVLLVALTALLAACSTGSEEAPNVKPAAPVSRGAGGDCVEAWNSPGNEANRSAAAAKHKGWSVELSEWRVDHSAPNPSGDDLVGAGCSFFFSSPTHWRSYSGGWEADGDLRWDRPPSNGGRRTPEQQLQPPNAVLRQNGRLERLASDSGSPVTPSEWRAVIDDWYDNGNVDDPHRCAAVQEALERVPAQGPNITTAHDDLLAYAGQVC